MQLNRIIVLSSIFLLLIVPGILVNNAFAFTTSDTLYSCDSPNNSAKEIHKLDKFDGTIISSNTMVISGLPGNVKGCTGLSEDPTTGIFYAIIQYQGGNSGNRNLVTIDPETGVGAAIDSMDDAFATLAFSSDGTLFAIGGNSANFQDRLYSVDKTTAIVTPLCSLPESGTGFNYLAYNWTEDVLYRLAGSGLAAGLPSDIHLDRINDVSTCDVSTTIISGSLTGSLFQASFNTNDQLYYVLMRDDNSGLPSYHSLTPNGDASLINGSPFTIDAKGLVFGLTLTLPDSDGDGVPDVDDVCQGFDDNIDSDGDGVPDGCDSVPTTIVTAIPTTGSAPLAVSFTCDSITGNTPLSYSWDFNGDGIEDSTDQNPLFTFDNAGDFTSTCTVSDSDNNSDFSSIPITVQPILVTLNVSPVTLPENAGTSVVTACTTFPVPANVIVTLSSSGDAILDTDYTIGNNILTISTGNSCTSTDILSIEDFLVEGDENIVVDIDTVVGAIENGEQQVTVSIIDNDVPVLVTLSISELQLLENGGTSVVTATLDQIPPTDIIVTIGFSGDAVEGDDYTTSSNIITIPALSNSGSIVLTAIDDALVEGDENIVVDIDTVVGLDGLTAVEDGEQQVTAIIIDDDISVCTTLDFDSLPAGTIVTDQFASSGIIISAENNKSSHPDAAILFNSAAPTGGDFDLGTPNEDFGGPGIGNGGEAGQLGENNAALGNLLIIAEDIKDKNPADGLVDDPDDEAKGGTIQFNFDTISRVESVTFVDIDSDEYGGSVMVMTTPSGDVSIPINALGDNSVQTVLVNQDDVTDFKIELVSSGAIASINYCPGTEPVPEDEPIIITGIHDGNLIVGPDDVVIIDGATINGKVKIDGGDVSMINGCVVNGNVSSKNSGILSIDACTINGKVTVKTGSLTISGDSEITKNTSVKDTDFVTITDNPNSFGKNLRIDNGGTVDVTNNHVSENLRVKNSGDVTITNNVVDGHLRSLDNDSTTVTSNTVAKNLNTGGTDIVFITDNTVGQNLRAAESTSVEITDNTAGENLRVKKSTNVFIDNNQSGKDLRVLNNDGVIITNNHADKNINIKKNTECSEFNNTADGKIRIKDCVNGLPEE